MSGSHPWTSFHIYLGECQDRSDGLISKQLPAIADQFAARWFFLRYTDETGPHIRFRIENGSNEAENIIEALSDALALLPMRPRDVPRPLVNLGGLSVAQGGTAMQVFRREYEREWAKYVSPLGADVVESSFCRSTELSVALLQASSLNVDLRKNLGPHIVRKALTMMLPERAPSDAAERYAEYWLNRLNGRDLRRRFEAKADQLASSGMLDDGEDSIAGAVLPLFHAWIDSLAEVRRTFEVEKLYRDSSHEEILAYDMLHLMNNRLGFTLVEEPYLALLAARMGRVDAVYI